MFYYCAKCNVEYGYACDDLTFPQRKGIHVPHCPECGSILVEKYKKNKKTKTEYCLAKVLFKKVKAVVKKELKKEVKKAVVKKEVKKAVVKKEVKKKAGKIIELNMEQAKKACTDIRLGCDVCPFKKDAKKSDKICWKVRDYIIGK